MTKSQQVIEHIIVTFVEAALAYLIVIPTVNWTRTAIAGAVGAGLSAAYNVLRQSTPTMPPTPVVVTPPLPAVVSPELPTNTVSENSNSINGEGDTPPSPLLN